MFSRSRGEAKWKLIRRRQLRGKKRKRLLDLDGYPDCSFIFITGAAARNVFIAFGKKILVLPRAV